nr:uncharacterized protein LOC108075175 isoform X2 [Drosophila kikkawai]
MDNGQERRQQQTKLGKLGKLEKGKQETNLNEMCQMLTHAAPQNWNSLFYSFGRRPKTSIPLPLNTTSNKLRNWKWTRHGVLDPAQTSFICNLWLDGWMDGWMPAIIWTALVARTRNEHGQLQLRRGEGKGGPDLEGFARWQMARAIELTIEIVSRTHLSVRVSADISKHWKKWRRDRVHT